MFFLLHAEPNFVLRVSRLLMLEINGYFAHASPMNIIRNMSILNVINSLLFITIFGFT